eukprot:COSAG01_NODE_984_length_12344_cov_215.085362_3_plen_41_part_00
MMLRSRYGAEQSSAWVGLSDALYQQTVSPTCVIMLGCPWL